MPITQSDHRRQSIDFLKVQPSLRTRRVRPNSLFSSSSSNSTPNSSRVHSPDPFDEFCQSLPLYGRSSAIAGVRRSVSQRESSRHWSVQSDQERILSEKLAMLARTQNLKLESPPNSPTKGMTSIREVARANAFAKLSGEDSIDARICDFDQRSSGLARRRSVKENVLVISNEDLDKLGADMLENSPTVSMPPQPVQYGPSRPVDLNGGLLSWKMAKEVMIPGSSSSNRGTVGEHNKDLFSILLFLFTSFADPQTISQINAKDLSIFPSQEVFMSVKSQLDLSLRAILCGLCTKLIGLGGLLVVVLQMSVLLTMVVLSNIGESVTSWGGEKVASAMHVYKLRTREFKSAHMRRVLRRSLE